MLVTFHRANDGGHIWTVQAANYRIIGRSSESYKNKADAVSNFEQLTGRAVLQDKDIESKNYALLEPNSLSDEWEVKFE